MPKKWNKETQTEGMGEDIMQTGLTGLNFIRIDLMEINLWKMSLSGAVFIIVIALVRAVLVNKLPKKTFYILWMVALLRLLLPVSIPSPFSIYTLLPENLTGDPAAAGPGQSAAADMGQNPADIKPAADNAGMGQSPADAVDSGQQAAVPAGPDTRKAVSRHPAAAFIRKAVWAAGCILCFCTFGILYIICRRRFAESLPVELPVTAKWLAAHSLRRPIQIRQSSRIQTPLTYGLFHPVILMPKRTDWKNERDLAYILAHEYIHIRRFDLLTKLLLTAAVSLHWFNPFVWIMYLLFNRDLEISCDELILRIVKDGSRSEYAEVLIKMEETKCIHAPLCSSFCKHAIEERMIAIMKMKKLTVLTGITAAALVLGISGVFATSAAASGKEQKARPVTDSAIQMEGSAGQDRNAAKSREDEHVDYTAQANEDSVYEQGNHGDQNWTKQEAVADEVRELEYDEGLETVYNPKGEAVSEGNGTETGYKTKAQEFAVYKDAKFSDYEKYGLSYDKKTGYLMYKGRKVGYFKDEWAEQTYTFFVEDAGETGIIVLRDKKYKITGLKEVTIPYIIKNTDENKIEQSYAISQEETYAAADAGKEIDSVCGVPAEYQKAGVVNDDKTGRWLYKGRAVAVFYDYCGFIYTTDEAEKEPVYLEAFRDADGNVKEIKEVTKKRIKNLLQNT